MNNVISGTYRSTQVEEIENGGCETNGNVEDPFENGQGKLLKSTAIFSDGTICIDSNQTNTLSRHKQPMRKTKTFEVRNSYLTDAYKNTDIRCCRHLCYAFLPMWVGRLMILDYLDNKPFRVPGISTIRGGLRSFHYFPLSLAICLLVSVIVLEGFRLWIKLRLKLRNVKRVVFDRVCVITLITFLVAFLGTTWWLLIISNVGKATKSFIALDQIRVLMKIIAFLSTKIDEALADTPKNETSQQQLCPSIFKFLYFAFAPTLIYSDEYPRTDRIRWSFVVENLVETVLIYYAGAVIVEEGLIPSCLAYVTKPIPVTFWSYLLLLIQNMIPSFGFLFLMNFGVLHSSQNFFAELLRFVDRRFYGDWWNAVSPNGYFRTSNFLVQDWIYYYLYLPLRNWTGNRFIPQLCVMWLSAIIHEICLGISIGFFIPVLFASFGFMGGLFVICGVKERNEIVQKFLYLLTFPIGCSMITTFYTVEHFAREHCKRTIDSNWDYLIPRSCNCILMDVIPKV